MIENSEFFDPPACCPPRMLHQGVPCGPKERMRRHTASKPSLWIVGERRDLLADGRYGILRLRSKGVPRSLPR